MNFVFVCFLTVGMSTSALAVEISGPGKAFDWIKPEIRMANGNSLRLAGVPIRMEDLPMALEVTPAGVASILPIPYKSLQTVAPFEFPVLPTMEVTGSMVKRLSGVVTLYPASDPELVAADPNAAPAPRDFLIEVTGLLEGEGREQALFVDSYKVLGQAGRVNGVLENRTAGKLTLRTPNGTLVKLVGDQTQFLERKMPDPKDGLEITGNMAPPGVAPSVRLLSYRVLPDFAASMVNSGVSAGARIASKAPTKVRGRLARLPNRQPVLFVEGGRRYRLSDRQYNELIRLRAREDQLFELAGMWDGDPESGVLQVVSYRPVTANQAGDWIPFRGVALEQLERRPQVLEGAIVPGRDGSPWLRAADGRMYRLSGEMVASLVNDPYSRSYLAECTGYFAGRYSDPELKLTSYRFLAVPISSSPFQQRWSNSAWYQDRPLILQGRMVYPASGEPRFRTNDGITIALVGAALGALLNKSPSNDGLLEMQGVMAGQGNQRRLNVSSFKSLSASHDVRQAIIAAPLAPVAIAPPVRADFSSPGQLPAVAVALGMADQPITSQAAANAAAAARQLLRNAIVPRTASPVAQPLPVATPAARPLLVTPPIAKPLPVMPPVAAPVAAPVVTPIVAPVSAPIVAPAAAPAAPPVSAPMRSSPALGTPTSPSEPAPEEQPARQRRPKHERSGRHDSSRWENEQGDSRAGSEASVEKPDQRRSPDAEQTPAGAASESASTAPESVNAPDERRERRREPREGHRRSRNRN